jgi:hypothetical protein
VAVLAAWRWDQGIGDYHLLEKCHLDGANACVPTLPRPVHGRLALVLKPGVSWGNNQVISLNK